MWYGICLRKWRHEFLRNAIGARTEPIRSFKKKPHNMSVHAPNGLGVSCCGADMISSATWKPGPAGSVTPWLDGTLDGFANLRRLRPVPEPGLGLGELHKRHRL